MTFHFQIVYILYLSSLASVTGAVKPASSSAAWNDSLMARNDSEQEKKLHCTLP